MKGFFDPAGIVVFGISQRPSNLGRIIMENLERFRFSGPFHAVGAKGGHIGKKRIYMSLDEVDGTPELAVILVPASRVPGVLNECAEKGIGHVIIESGGFSEFSEDREALEEEIRTTARRFGIRVIGPNCFGVINPSKGVVLPFFVLDPAYLKGGSVSLISQSGGVFYDACMLSSCENMGLGKLVSIGNKLMINENYCLEYLINDEETSVIGLYLEHFSDGGEFVRLASSSDKPIVLLKANRSPASEEIARFHTAALAGDDEVAEAAMAQAGVTMVRNLQEMFHCLKIFSIEPMKGRRLAVISRSGGHSVLAADSAGRHGLELARFSDRFFLAATAKKLNVIRATNPLDVGDIYDLDDYSDILTLALSEDGVDGVVFVVTYSPEREGVKIARFIDQVLKLSSNFKKPVALSVITNKNEWFSIKDISDFPVFSDCDHAIWALSRSFIHFDYRERTRRFHLLLDRKPAKIARSGRAELLSPGDVFSLLRKYGLPAAEYAVVDSVTSALDTAHAIGYPVALKSASCHILHKTEAKGVILNISDAERLAAAIKDMPSEQYLIQKMYPPGAEVFMGVKHDNDFGHVILLGLGGIHVELFKDRTLRVLPIDGDTAEEMIHGIRGVAILKGYRGEPPRDTKALKDALLAISKMIWENPGIEELDLNPVIVYEEGNGAVIVDGKMRVR